MSPARTQSTLIHMFTKLGIEEKYWILRDEYLELLPGIPWVHGVIACQITRQAQHYPLFFWTYLWLIDWFEDDLPWCVLWWLSMAVFPTKDGFSTNTLTYNHDSLTKCVTWANVFKISEVIAREARPAAADVEERATKPCSFFHKMSFGGIQNLLTPANYKEGEKIDLLPLVLHLTKDPESLIMELKKNGKHISSGKFQIPDTVRKTRTNTGSF